ncbi:DUF2971 domain-containing protein [Nonlabens sp. Asnod3-A02]|uniref:DUF2971 domain-containing protein n=1 Tax=Nonlabens sp. Asnod3-A02 TaxID=3160579 RepID=UPI00386A6606
MREETVYHYTTLETLFHIINQSTVNSLTLRATHVDFLNDFTEHTIAVGLLKKELISYDNTLSNDSKNFSKTLNDKRMSFFRNEEIDELYPHIISFSECGDSLPMWNTYADKSKGIALGFDKSLLAELNEDYRLEKCEYDSSRYEEYLKQNIQKLHESTEVDSYSIGFTQDFDSSILQDHFKYLPILKDKGYAYEKECRLIIPNKISELSSLKFQVTDSIYKPYKEIEFPFECLTEIILGPCLSLEKMKTSLNLILNQKGKKLSLNKKNGKILLKQSEIPYRNV